MDKSHAREGNGAIRFMRTGQQGVLLWAADGACRIGIDLFLSDLPGRLLHNVVDVGDLGDVSLLFGTHDHADHIDRAAWTQAAALHPRLRFVAPKHFAHTLPDALSIDPRRFLFVDEDSPADDGEWHIEAVAAAHEFLDTDDEGHHPYLIYVLTFRGRTICHMGDTCLYEGLPDKLRRYGRFDALFLPINGRDAERYRRNCIGNMTFQEAADLTGALAPRLAIPGHYDMFADNGENPRRYLDYVNVKYPGQQVRLLAPGEVCQLP